MSTTKWVVTIALVCLFGCTEQEDSGPIKAADTVFKNGRVFTFDWDDPSPFGQLADNAPLQSGVISSDAEAIAVKDGLITYVGSNQEAQNWVGESTQVIDLKNRTLLPGLTDSHTHVFNLGQALSRVSLFGIETEQEAVKKIAEFAKSVPKGEWIVGQGWDEGAWANRYPDKHLLTEAVPDHPVFMRSLHSFAGWCNQKALDGAQITKETEAPNGGEIKLGADGEPSGLFLNRAVPLLENAIPPLSRQQLRQQVSLAVKQMAKDGYVAVHDAGLNSEELSVLLDMAEQEALPIRVYAMLSVRDTTLMEQWLSKGPEKDNQQKLVVRSIKAFYDGALGSRGAKLLQDYADQAGYRGVSGQEYGFDQSLVTELMRAGFQVAIHAIGDAGNRESLDFLESVYEKFPDTRNGRHRIEHAQILHPLDIPRFEQLSVIASMEPPHAVEDKTWAEARLGPERIKGAYAWRSLRENGARLIFNSDNPGSDHSIFYGLYAAVTRKDKQGEPDGGWYVRESLSMDEAIRAYTVWAAYAGFREEQTGVIKPGNWADFSVMDIDPFALAQKAPDEILDGKIQMTVVGGEIVYEAQD